MDKKTINILFFDKLRGWVTSTIEVDAEENIDAPDYSDDSVNNIQEVLTSD